MVSVPIMNRMAAAGRAAAVAARWNRGKVQVFYLNSAFDVMLPRCPQCGLTMVPKSLAEGKMLEVEALLEDK